MEGDHLRQLIGKVSAVLGHAFGEAVFFDHRVGQVVGLDTLAEHLAVGGDTTHRDPPKVHTVITLDAADEARFARLSLQAPIGAGHLQGGIGGFGAGARKEGVVEVARHDVAQALCQLERLGLAELKGGGVVEGAQLLVHGVGDFSPVVAQAAGPQARQAIHDAPAFVVDEVAALGADDDARIFLELAIARVGHPVGIEALRAHGVFAAAGRMGVQGLNGARHGGNLSLG